MVLPSAQWDYANSIGGDLYTTLELDGRWVQDHTIEFIADNETLVNIISGYAESYTNHKEIILDEIECISEIVTKFSWGPRNFNDYPVKWR